MSQVHSSASGWTARRVLVTGADGFVGRWLIRALLDRGARVGALIRPGSTRPPKSHWDVRETEVPVASCDITDLAGISKLIADWEIETVYHLAAINTNTGTDASPYRILETNTRGVYTVLEACRVAAKPVRVVVASSKEVEDCFLPGATRRHHPYMVSKAAAELAARAYHDVFQLPVALVRSDNLYGGGDFNWSRLVPSTIRSIFQGETPVIRGDGRLRRDYVYIEDAVAAYLAIGERLGDPAVQGRLFRVATGVGTSVLEMVQQIVRAAGAPDLQPRILNEKSDERVDTFYAPELEQVMLGWRNQCSLAEGLTRTCRWYHDFFKKTTTPR